MRGRSGIDGSVIFDNLPELKSVLFTGESFYYAFDFVLCGREWSGEELLLDLPQLTSVVMDITCLSENTKSTSTISIRHGEVPSEIVDMLYDRYGDSERICIEELELEWS